MMGECPRASDRTTLESERGEEEVQSSDASWDHEPPGFQISDSKSQIFGSWVRRSLKC